MRDTELKKLKPREEKGIGRGLRVKKNKDGSCSWIFMKRIKGRPQQQGSMRTTLGRWPEMTLDQAEEKARHYRSLLDQGINPKEYDERRKKEAAAKAEEEEAKAITLRQLLERYQRNAHLYDRGVSPHYMKGFKSTIENVWSRFIDTPIQDIQGRHLREEFEYWNSQRVSPKTGKPAPTMSTQGVNHGRALFNFAIDQLELLDRNPFNVFRRQLKSSRRSTYYLLPKEAVKVLDTITKIGHHSQWIKKYGFEESQQALARDGLHVLKPYAFTEFANSVFNNLSLTLLTGLRGPSEVTPLKWENVFLEKSEWEGRGAECAYFKTWTKQKRWFGIPITPYMERIFREQKALKTNDYVFPAKRRDGSMESGRYAYDAINELLNPSLKFSQTNKVGPRVLRHTFATACHHAYPFNLELAHQLTGHGPDKKGGETEIYIHGNANQMLPYFIEINKLLVGDVEQMPDTWNVEDSFSEEELEEMDKPEFADFPIVEGGYTVEP